MEEYLDDFVTSVQIYKSSSKIGKIQIYLAKQWNGSITDSLTCWWADAVLQAQTASTLP